MTAYLVSRTRNRVVISFQLIVEQGDNCAMHKRNRKGLVGVSCDCGTRDVKFIFDECFCDL